MIYFRTVVKKILQSASPPLYPDKLLLIADFMKKAGPVFLTELFPILNSRLYELLKTLHQDDWHKPTICKAWQVKDIVAHLLDGNIRRLSMQRDHYFSPALKPELASGEKLLDYLNRLNAEWVQAAKRMSPNILTEWLAQSNEELYIMFKLMAPHDPALFSVAWAGEESSENWFDIAREYTEKWLHQQQIREALGRPGIMTQELYYPFLDTFMRALPHTYRETEAEEGTVLKFTVHGELRGDWFLYKTKEQWLLAYELSEIPLSEVRIPAGTAWKLFSKGISPDEARANIEVRGERLYGEVVLSMVSVMA